MWGLSNSCISNMVWSNWKKKSFLPEIKNGFTFYAISLYYSVIHTDASFVCYYLDGIFHRLIVRFSHWALKKPAPKLKYHFGEFRVGKQDYQHRCMLQMRPTKPACIKVYKNITILGLYLNKKWPKIVLYNPEMLTETTPWNVFVFVFVFFNSHLVKIKESNYLSLLKRSQLDVFCP